MKIPLYVVDAFTRRVFGGNPAAVCPLEEWPDEAVMQKIAMENNLSETAFFAREGEAYRLRWFTPSVEIKLCGHATLASAYVIFNYLDSSKESVSFETLSGTLVARRDGERIALDFPSRPASPTDAPEDLLAALGVRPREVLRSAVDYMAIYETEEEVLSLRPDMARLARVEALGLIATAPGRESDCASRYFAPRAGIPEDPVTGAAHCTLTPYWSARLGKREIHARQVSARGGEVFCEARGERVTLAGYAARYSEGFLYL
ncbi:MAG TPA: PhzF family phenazine biosynthesis protein [Pyrinomonadaceae bacterium]|nr:PhzF family phenazine biosynthesis protein [Pyrinomonadaceae bacterium]